MRTPVLGGSLKLPPAHELGIAHSTLQKAENQWDTFERVTDKLERFGMPPPTTPSLTWEPVSPELLLTADIKQYTIMYASQLRWFNYANRLLAAARAHLLGAENQLKDLQAAARATLRKLEPAGEKKKLTIPEVKDLVESIRALSTSV